MQLDKQTDSSKGSTTKPTRMRNIIALGKTQQVVLRVSRLFSWEEARGGKHEEARQLSPFEAPNLASSFCEPSRSRHDVWRESTSSSRQVSSLSVTFIASDILCANKRSLRSLRPRANLYGSLPVLSTLMMLFAEASIFLILLMIMMKLVKRAKKLVALSERRTKNPRKPQRMTVVLSHRRG